MIVLADVMVGPLILMFPPLGLLFLILVIAIEAGILRLRRWGSFGASLKDAAIANLISTVLGVVPGVALLLAAFQCPMIPVGDHFEKRCSWAFPPLIILALMWGLSVIIEGGVLIRLRHRPAREVWRTLTIANVVSYVLLSPMFLF
jgi:hypothetical protein